MATVRPSTSSNQAAGQSRNLPGTDSSAAVSHGRSAAEIDARRDQPAWFALQYTSRIKLDEKLFNEIGRLIALIEHVHAELTAGSPLRADEDYRRMLVHWRIDSFTVIEARLDHDLTNAGDFSRSSIEARIRAGYDNATPRRRLARG
jgi:hypothetical protein